MADGELSKFRALALQAVPWWLRSGTAARVLHAVGAVNDTLADAMIAAVKSRFPNLYSNESLPYLGNDRKIIRGRFDTDESYAERLRRWLDDHRTRGNGFSMLRQLWLHFRPNNFPISLVSYNGVRHTLDPVTGNVTRDVISWLPDAEASKWARWWLFYDWPGTAAADGVWSDPGTWSDGGAWDSSLDPAEVIDLRAVPSAWGNAHSMGDLILFTGNGELWDYPPGTWDEPGGVWDTDPPGVTRIALD
jgi:hypothetical protein